MSDETGMKAPTLFTTMYMYAAPQDAVPASMRRTGAIGSVRHRMTGLCRILQTDFGEFHFYEVG